MTPPKLPAEVVLELGLDDPEDSQSIQTRLAAKLGLETYELPPFELCRRALDARRGRVRFHLVYALAPTPRTLGGAPLRQVGPGAGAVIVGAGPAGLLCAYELARHGVTSTIVERGQPVTRRKEQVLLLNCGGPLDPDSNYCFGEGGAGTFSDGKLYTRSTKRGSPRDVLELLVLHGAPRAILTDARPHLGSDRLPAIVENLRSSLERVGVTFRFGARVVDLITVARGIARQAVGVRLSDGTELGGRAVVLATGHSAHEVYLCLCRHGAKLEPKAFAVGLRVEHPQELINRIQYGACAGHPRLPAASYRVAEEVEGRGVFSFCMCPGGQIVPAVTDPDGLVINGMSLSGRGSGYANSGLVVAVTVEDLRQAGYPGPLGGLELVRRVEQAGNRVGGPGLRAPAVRVLDFQGARVSTSLPPSSYGPGLVPEDVQSVLDESRLDIAKRIRSALCAFERRLPGYLSKEAVLVGVETRTSSPVRVVRDPDTLQAQGISRLYPAGEGAGYAGGIVSSAVDGIRVARSLLRVMCS